MRAIAVVILATVTLALVVLEAARPLAQGVPAPPMQFPLEPAGDVILDPSGATAEGSLPVAFVRSPDRTGPGGRGRYLIVVNSGYGIQVDRAGNEGLQMLQVVDLAASPAPAVIQSVYFPTPASVNIGAAFASSPNPDGTWSLFASGGVQDRVWRFTFTADANQPLSPANDAQAKTVNAPFIDLSPVAPATRLALRKDRPGLVYPAGLAVGSSHSLYVAANLSDALVVGSTGPSGARLRAISLTDPRRPDHHVYPYDVVVVPANGGDTVFVSCWNDQAVAVVNPGTRRVTRRIPVGAHPGALLLDASKSRLFVASANADAVSIVDVRNEREMVRIPVGLRPSLPGSSSQAIALSEDETTLYVADAQSQAIAVVRLGADARVASSTDTDGDEHEREKADEDDDRSRVIGFIPAARYPSALALVGSTLFVGNGKGEPPARGNAPNAAFPPNDKLRGAYSVSLLRSSLRRVAVPDTAALAGMTEAVMRANGLVGPRVERLFPGESPITHVIYIIKENRTYDQVLGDVPAAGDGTPADGEPSLALFGQGEAARRRGGPPQSIAPNHRALALRFGLFDRFFVNSEASADGHNWATAAFSSDYVDKAFRSNYSSRGRTYDYEGFNRLPDYEPAASLPPLLTLPLTAEDVASFMQRYVPYLNGSRDVAEPDSLYIWDAAARAGVSYKSYGEFIGTVSADDIAALNARRSKTYPDLSPTVATVPTKAALEAHHSTTFRAFDMWTPDAMTTDSYRAAKARGTDALIRSDHPDARFRGYSRLGAWLDEFRDHVASLERGDDTLPALTIMRFPVDHTIGLRRHHATPQFMMADNDYAVGRLVEAVSKSPYWKSTAVFVLEDDAQDGPDHVDMHRSPLLVVSAWNKPGQLVHAMHNTVSAIRTIELLLGIEPMHQLDAAAAPMDIFTTTPDLAPYTAELPVVADDNLIYEKPRSARERQLLDQLARQDLENPDMADSRVLNEAIWVSVRGDAPMPAPSRLAAADAMQSGLDEAGERAARQPLYLARMALLKATGRR